MADEAGDTPALTGAMMADAFGYVGPLAESVVVVYDMAAVPNRATTRKNRKTGHPFRHVGSLHECVDLVVPAGPGAPVAAITVELLAALGVKRLVSVGLAGLLQPNNNSLYVIETAESDEGTSRHYSADLGAERELTDALQRGLGATPAVTLTTDVPFRHTANRLASHRERATVVEMECAAFFAVANHFDIAAAAVLVASDVFDEDGWRRLPGATNHAMLTKAVVDVAQILADRGG